MDCHQGITAGSSPGRGTNTPGEFTQYRWFMCNAVCRLKFNELIYRIAWVNFGLNIDLFQKTFRNLLNTL
jgi:hypothetical protein